MCVVVADGAWWVVFILLEMIVSCAVPWISKAISVEVVAIETEPVIHPKEMTRVYDTFDTFEIALIMDIQSIELSVEERQYYPKTVHFSDPLVTHSWKVPRIEQTIKSTMFYSDRDIMRFRGEHRTRFGKGGKYNRVSCDQMLESLDQRAAARDAYLRALDAIKSWSTAKKDDCGRTT